jgi:glucan phosphoethanolaminetransferase (alkaline phosphatase superfamily)
VYQSWKLIPSSFLHLQKMKKLLLVFQFSNPDNRRFLLALIFTLFMYVVEHFVSSQQGYFLFLIERRQGIEPVTGLLTTAMIFLAFTLFTWFSFYLPLWGRFIWAVLLSIATIVQYGYWKAFHRFISEIDLDTVLTAPPRMWNDAATIFLNAVALLPIGAYAICAILSGKQKLSRTRWLLFPIALMLWGTVLISQSNGWLTNPGLSGFQFYQTITQWVLSSSRHITRQTVEPIQQSLPVNNLIFIIDESIRGDHLQINGYERSTTPYLDSLSNDGYMYNWGIAVAGGTCSQIANSLLITGVQIVDDISTVKKQTIEYPTVFHFAKAAGYTTYYLDAQTDYLWNGLTFNDLAYIDNWLNIHQMGTDVYADMRAADIIRDILDISTGNFIVLNKRGVHFLYEHSYPPEATLWGPVPIDYLKEPDLVKNP